MVGDDLRVNRCLENGAGPRKLPLQLRCIDQVSVVGKRQRSLDIVENKRLRILDGALPGCRIPDMSDTDVAFESLEALRVEILVHQSHAPPASDCSLRTVCVTDRNPAALLSPVLQGKKAIIDGRRHLFLAGEIIDTEDTAFLAGAV